MVFGIYHELSLKRVINLAEGDGPHTTDKSTKQDDTGKSQDKPVPSNEPAKQDSRKSQDGTAKPDDQPQPDEQANHGETANSDETVESNEPSQPPEAAIPDNNVASTEPAKPAQPNEPPIPDPDPRSPTETTPLLQHHSDSPSASRPDASQPDGQTLFKTLLAALQQLRRQLVRIVTQTLGFLSLLGFRRASQKKPSGQRGTDIIKRCGSVTEAVIWGQKMVAWLQFRAALVRLQEYLLDLPASACHLARRPRRGLMKYAPRASAVALLSLRPIT